LSAPERPPPGTVEHYLFLFRRERGWTRALVAALPEESFDWRPAPDAFSCGEVVRHLILAERFWRRLLVEAVAGRRWDPFGYQGGVVARLEAFRARNLASAASGAEGGTFTACLDHWAKVQRETEAVVAALTAEQLERVIVHHPIALFEAPIGEMLHYMMSHEIHHRGQLSAYAKMLGVRQPPVVVAL
jgi:uncharacterized damage-inducible protein DinB